MISNQIERDLRSPSPPSQLRSTVVLTIVADCLSLPPPLK
ncbi:hypothetical protein QN277_006782 [Acacia crassicarpa]|uniref:Uncharacterized protein n=1 Tax=Acacia crassicarpa TaxID=499986 RepID=A0AAE1IVM7_9FABA|nr:hypothetical protein QN277_006782 [Acacia crassicarpa]